METPKIECSNCNLMTIEITSKMNDDYSTTITFHKCSNCGYIMTENEVDKYLNEFNEMLTK